MFPLIFAFLTALVAAALFYRHKQAELIHLERMTAMEKGVALPVFEPASPDPIRRYLLAGMIWLFSGAGLAIFLFALSATAQTRGFESMQEREAKVEALRKLGAGDDELRRVINERSPSDARVPFGLGTLGFIPMGVGLAYLIFYVSERKRYTPHQ